MEVVFKVLEQFKKKSDFVPQRHLAMCPALSPRSFRETSFVQRSEAGRGGNSAKRRCQSATPISSAAFPTCAAHSPWWEGLTFALDVDLPSRIKSGAIASLTCVVTPAPCDDVAWLPQVILGRLLFRMMCSCISNYQISGYKGIFAASLQITRL